MGLDFLYWLLFAVKRRTTNKLKNKEGVNLLGKEILVHLRSLKRLVR